MSSSNRSGPWHEVRRSSLHGNGVFARRFIPKGTYILEYEGRHLTAEEADAQEPTDPNDPFHTFFFAISNGMIIDGGQNGLLIIAANPTVKAMKTNTVTAYLSWPYAILQRAKSCCMTTP